jgi:hypothetical protein
MNRYTKTVLSAATVVGGLMAAGCHSTGTGEWNWHDDPCWPDRYANESRAAVVATFQPQVENGHILDQTLWNTHFEYGTDKLNGAGMDKLDQLARRRPMPDQHVFLQTARDIGYDAEKPGDYAAKRVELDNKRTESVRKYLKATLTGRELTFEIQVHDPSMPGIDGAAPRVILPPPSSRVGAASGGGAGAAAPGTVAPGAASGGPGASPGTSGSSGYSGSSGTSRP